MVRAPPPVPASVVIVPVPELTSWPLFTFRVANRTFAESLLSTIAPSLVKPFDSVKVLFPTGPAIRSVAPAALAKPPVIEEPPPTVSVP